MPGTKHSVEQIMRKLRRAEVELAEGGAVEQVCRSLEVTKQTYYRWRREHGGMEVSQAKRPNELERENMRLRKLVSGQALDMLILMEAMSGRDEPGPTP